MGEPELDRDALPRDLDALERALLTRTREAAPSGLRRRVLLGLRSERRREEARARWSFAALAAAVAALWINLAILSSLRTAIPEVSAATGPSVAAIAREIHRLLPEIGEGEAVRHAVIYRGGPRPGPCVLPRGAGLRATLSPATLRPRNPGTLGGSPSPKEMTPWDTLFSGS
jgi:hypothetical protein